MNVLWGPAQCLFSSLHLAYWHLEWREMLPLIIRVKNILLPRPLVPKLWPASESPGVFSRWRSGVGLRIYISNKFPGDSDSVSCGVTFWELLAKLIIHFKKCIPLTRKFMYDSHNGRGSHGGRVTINLSSLLTEYKYILEFQVVRMLIKIIIPLLTHLFGWI